ncbi:TetR/AcrR family transcriptional regulator [Salinibacterium sp. G-O1]|uniref:TetR/AcrR family transcriptional regulator n=1 Tax=Salinibacterium sp. G-O1 TaxID=3046208 RepID=UPI0024BA04FF|nr:TetR/AcrR family transcriptional regulator [Salinibacterium sp. G-O1]MDJ0333831.1 TetR/AcrR family transcriptional regulator [Salinibacterium sp. G-O1]
MGRPSKNILSSKTIALAALALVDEKGNFTIPGVAAALGVNASSLYHHLPGGRIAIVHRIREELYAEVDLTPLVDPSTPALDRLREWMFEIRSALARVPAIAPILVAAPVEDLRTLEIYEALFVILKDAGVPAARRAAYSAMIDAVILGSAVDAGSPIPLWRSEGFDLPELHAIASADNLQRANDGFSLAVDVVVDAVSKTEF